MDNRNSNCIVKNGWETPVVTEYGSVETITMGSFKNDGTQVFDLEFYKHDEHQCS